MGGVENKKYDYGIRYTLSAKRHPTDGRRMQAEEKGIKSLWTEPPCMAIKPAYVKKTGKLLLERYPDAFTTDFEQNKDSVEKFTNVESKGVRNRIAGYVTRKKGSQAATA